MKNIYLMLVLSIVPVFVFSQWITLTGGTEAQLYTVHFPNSDAGYIVGGDNYHPGFVLKTTNGGTTWETVLSGESVCYSVFFTNVNTGYVGNFNGDILTTINGGLTWTRKNIGTYRALYSIHFPDANHGYAAGVLGKIVKTNDGGTNWIDVSISTEDFFYSVFFTDIYKGFAVCNTSRMYKTINGGTDWTYQSSGLSRVNAVTFPDDSTGYAVGYNADDHAGGITKTINAGMTWTYKSTGAGVNLNSVSFPDVNTGYTVGNNGTILKTIDGGMTWHTQPSGTTKNLWSVYFPCPDTGFIVGDSGIILKTTNGGVTPLVTPPNRSVSSSAGSTFFIVTSDTNWVVSSDASWCSVTSSGSGNDTIIATYSENNTSTERGANITVYAAGSDSMTVTVTQSRSSIGVENIREDHFQIYPNPTNGIVTIETVEIVSNCQLFLTDLNGQKLFHQTITKPTTLTDISTLPPGIYFVKLVNDKMIKITKIIKL
jgi:photosystem II stability/assembly factor-like uncharacterized protein